jgi:HK97 family phage prohead protease
MTDNNIKVHPEGNRPRVEKTFELKSASARDGRYVRAIVSVFGNVDYQGDRTMPGAFTASLKWWAASGKGIPVIFSHDWGNPFSHIGVVTSAKETDVGLEIEAELDVDDNDVARQVYKLMKRGTLNEWSFAYDVVVEKQASDGANELIELNLWEVGPTLKGANPATATLDVKGRSDDLARIRQHLKTSHAGFSAVDVGQRNRSELLSLHRLAHAEIPCSPAHLRDATTDAGVEVPTAGKQERDRYNDLIDEAASRRKRRRKSEGELRAEVEMLYDEHVLPGQLAQLKAEGIIADAREHRRQRKRKEAERRRTEARR